MPSRERAWCSVFPDRSLSYGRLSAYYFFYFAFVGVCAPYFGLYLQFLRFSPGEIAVLLSQMQFMRLFGPWFWGTLSDRTGRRIFFVRMTACVALPVFIVLLFTRGFWGLLFLLALHSFFWVAALPLVETLTLEHLRERSADYGKIRLWGSVGFIVTVLGIGGLLERFPLSLVPWVSLVPLAGMLLISLSIPEPSARLSEGENASIRGLLSQKRVLAFFAAAFAMTAAHGPLNVFYSIFLTGYGYGTAFVGGLWTLGVLAEITFFYFMPGFMRRFRLRAILLLSFSAAVIRFIIIGFCVGYPALLALAQLLHGLTFGAFHSASIAVVNVLFSGKTRSRGQALYASSSFGAGGLAGSLAGGWLWGSLGPQAAFVFASLSALSGLVLVAMLGDDDRQD